MLLVCFSEINNMVNFLYTFETICACINPLSPRIYLLGLTTFLTQKGHIQQPSNHVDTSLEKVTLNQFTKNLTLNTLRPRQDGRHFPDDIFKCISWMKMFEFWLKSHWSLFLRVQYSIIGSDNGLAPSRRQDIIWTNDGKFTDDYMRHSASMS